MRCLQKEISHRLCKQLSKSYLREHTSQKVCVEHDTRRGRAAIFFINNKDADKG